MVETASSSPAPLIMVTGGARSGKSRWAETLAADLGIQLGLPVHYLATAVAGDPEMAERIRRHRERRPPEWSVVEETLDLSRVIGGLAPGVVLIDCLILWTANWLEARGMNDRAEELIAADTRDWLLALKSSSRPAVVVTGEVGLGLVPDNRMARVYRDLLGRANQELAVEAGQVYLVVSGIPVRIKP